MSGGYGAELVRHRDLGGVDVGDRDVHDPAVVVGHVDAAPVGEPRDDQARDALERRLVVERGGEQLARLGEEALAQLGVLGVGDVLDDVDRQAAAGRVLGQGRLGQQPERLSGVAPDAAGEQRRRGLALEQAAAGKVVDVHRRAVVLGDREARGELAGRAREHLLDALAPEQLRRGLVRVDRLAALVVDGDGLGERAEDPVEARLRGGEVARERLVAVGQVRRLLSRPRGDHREERDQCVEDDPVDRLPGARRVVPEQAADADRERDDGRDRGLALVADDGEREWHEQRGARDDDPGPRDRDVGDRDRELNDERDRETG